jgi:DNA modification methylase
MKLTENIEITNEDCFNFLKQKQNNSICLTITSPPYNLGKKHHTGSNFFNAYEGYDDNMLEEEYQFQQISVLNLLYNKTKEGGSLMYNHKNRIRNGIQISPYEWLFKTKWTIKQEVVWFNGSQNFDKIRFYPMTERIYWLSKGVETEFKNTINQHDLIKDNAVGTSKEHKRAFPLSLAERLIMCFPESKMICDPYSGSGTTAIASHNLNKTFTGSEISKKSFEQLTQRIKNHVAQQKLF